MIDLYGTKGVVTSMSRSAAREKVVYTSLKEVHRTGLDSEFPGHPPSIGVIVRRGHFGGNHLIYHTPKVSSLVSGESVECEDDDELTVRLRDDLYLMAGQCRELASDLLSHAERLEAEAVRESLIDDSAGGDVDASRDASADVGGDMDTDEDESSAAYTPDLDIFG